MKDGPSLPRRRLTRAEAKARTRQLLLEAAASVFASKGFAGASVEEIAEAAGFSIGAVYSNFGSKEELFLELSQAYRSDLIAEAAALVRGHRPRAEEAPGGGE
jgi:AcrR family transcriptional regulator